MPDVRVRVDEDQVEVLKRLVGEGDYSPQIFASYADALAFSAALGAAKGRSVPVLRPTKEPSPIRTDVFFNRGYDMLFSLLALHHEKDAQVLAGSIEYAERRTTVFEAYANGGLVYLAGELRGETDTFEALLLIMKEFYESRQVGASIPDIRRLLG